MIQRTYLQVVKERVKEPRKFIQVLLGPRQVGKTTLVKQVLSEYPYPYVFETADDIVGLDDAWLRNVWNQARLMLRQSEAVEMLLVIDEVQKIDNWSEIVKKEYDADTFNNIPIKVVLLGSASLLIMKGLTESLAGRFEQIFIPHWSFAEMQEAFGWSLDQYIFYGGYPGTSNLIDDEMRWKRYLRSSLIETSVSRDIMQLQRIEKPVLLRRLMDIGTLYSAQILSLNKIQGELQDKGNLTTLSQYLNLLDNAGLLSGLEKYSGTVFRQRASAPKFQTWNNALLSALADYSFEEVRNDAHLWGRWCESAVGSYLLNQSKVKDFKLLYWNEGSKEVDYVLQRGHQTVAIEVKSGQDSYNSGMAIFEKKNHPKASYTIGTDGIPFEMFFKMDPLSLFE